MMDLMRFFSACALFFCFLFLYLKFKAQQTIWLGITFLGFLFNAMMLIGLFLLAQEWRIPLALLAIVFVVFIAIVPFLMIGTFLVNGVKLIRNEGLRISKLLALFLGVALLLYVFIWPILVDVTQSHFLNTLYQWIIFTAGYLSLLLIFNGLSNVLNLIHLRKQPIDYFIVLGAGLLGKEVTPLLAGRINKGLEIRNKQGSGKLIFSGGQGPDELIPEGEAMSNYALDQGTPPEFVLKETESTNTYQNIKFSKEIIDADWSHDTDPKIAIVTNNYHVLRGLMQARDLGLNCVGYGSKSKFYFSLNAFLREFVAYLQMTFKIHVTIISVVGFFLFALFVLVKFII